MKLAAFICSAVAVIAAQFGAFTLAGLLVIVAVFCVGWLYGQRAKSPRV